LPIFLGSLLTIREFRICFFWLCQKLNLTNNGCELLFKFIKRLLPTNNKLPHSYRTLKKEVNEYKFQKYKVCVDCGEKISNNNCLKCSSSSNTHKLVETAIFDFETQLKEIYARNKDEISKYKGFQSQHLFIIQLLSLLF
jgi:hypothetical protein